MKYMKYKIISGRYETGKEEEQTGYRQLFGEDNIQYKFDLYFHWYNLVHEMGHCLVEKYGKQMSKVQEEMFVNELAVSYYRYIGESERLRELEGYLQAVIDMVPSPVPEGQTFTSFFESIWGTEALNNVMMYGFFQLNSVLEAMHKEKKFEDIAKELGVTLQASKPLKCTASVTSSNAAAFLEAAAENMRSFGFDVPEITLELNDNPMIQCAQTIME
ncbi:MAG: hypothetical protein J6O73_11205 [Lachnospiraceae bacterium]|nr:hypothetical protein [Lachnospiraceae bacterium]